MEKRELTKDDRNAAMALGHMFYDLSRENSNAGGLAMVCAAFMRMVPLLNVYELLALVETNTKAFRKYMNAFWGDGDAYIEALRHKAVEEAHTIFEKYQNKDGESINNAN